MLMLKCLRLQQSTALIALLKLPEHQNFKSVYLQKKKKSLKSEQSSCLPQHTVTTVRRFTGLRLHHMNPWGLFDTSHDVTYVDTFPKAVTRRPAWPRLRHGAHFLTAPSRQTRTPIVSQTVWRASSRPPLFACLLLLTQPFYTPN